MSGVTIETTDTDLCVSRINTDGLNHAKELYTLESVTRHNAFTSIQIKTHVSQIHKIGMKYIEKLESFMKDQDK